MINFSARLLEAFIALEDCLQFTQAARRCNVSQSAFSQMIARLEAQVGARLFDRDTRSVKLTAEGELFAVTARRIAVDIDLAMAEMRDYSDKKRGKLALATLPSLAAEWIPSLLEKYSARFPGISLELFDTYSERGLQLLREGRVEIAVTALPGNVGEFAATALFEEPFHLICPRGHPVTQRKVLHLSDFAGLPIIHQVSTENIRVISGKNLHRLRPLLRELHVKETGIEIEHLATLAGLVSHGMGVSVIPRAFVSHFKNANVSLLPISSNAFMRQIYVLRRTGQSLSAAGVAFIELMEQNLPHDTDIL